MTEEKPYYLQDSSDDEGHEKHEGDHPTMEKKRWHLRAKGEDAGKPAQKTETAAQTEQRLKAQLGKVEIDPNISMSGSHMKNGSAADLPRLCRLDVSRARPGVEGEPGQGWND